MISNDIFLKNLTENLIYINIDYIEEINKKFS